VLGPLSRLENKESQSKYVLVVDALDECDDQNNVQIILQRLAEVQSLRGVQLRVLLTSRPEVPIQYGFTQVRREEHRDFVLHDIERTVVEHDISVFLRHQLGLVREKCRLEAGWPEEGAIARLVQNSGGLFIWAATACRFIAEDSQLAETRLCSLVHQGGSGTLPPERKLDEIYTTVLTSSMRGEYSEAESQTLHKQFRQVVGAIVTMQDALSVASLAELLQKDVTTLRRTLANLHSVLNVPDDQSRPIRLLHPSLRNFLFDRNRCNFRFYIHEKIIHEKLAGCCIKLMSAPTSLRQNVCSLSEPSTLGSEIGEDILAISLSSELLYACRYWVDHLEHSQQNVIDGDAVHVFLQHHLLPWVEAMSLMGDTANCVRLLAVLQGLVAVRGTEHNLYSFTDMERSHLQALPVVLCMKHGNSYRNSDRK
jgi:hypothetical protein